MKHNKKPCYRKRTARRAVLVEILYQLLHNCRNKLCSKSRTNRSNAVIRLYTRRCDPQARPPTSFVGNTVDLPLQNFLSPEFETKFQKKIPALLKVYLDLSPNFLITQCKISRRKLQCQNLLDSSSTLIQACNEQTHGRSDKRRQQIPR